ncbi:MAG: ribosome-associated translation inhibitor RaiA [Bacilli bacterium]|nr:ribosome-associated translation inhibitor RaiA [Bacilli bacterium]
MKFNIRGNKVKITEAINDYIENKIGRLGRYLENSDNVTANVVVKIRGVEQIVEVTIHLNKVILRAEVEDKNLYAAIDLVSEKLERQIRKNKTRMNKKANRDNVKGLVTNFEINKDDEKEENKVVKRKTVEMKPMSEEEAIFQMNLIDHDFFVYLDEKSDRICIVYKRKDNNYGIIATN